MNKHSTVRKQFFRYVSQNILGMIGVSAYILADTFFIAQAQGADGIAALNLVLPVYSLIFALGAKRSRSLITSSTICANSGCPVGSPFPAKVIASGFWPAAAISASFPSSSERTSAREGIFRCGRWEPLRPHSQ